MRPEVGDGSRRPADRLIHARDCATRALGQALRRQPLSDAKVRFAWNASVGSALARATTVRLHADGTLEVHTHSDHWRRETIRSTTVIRVRLAELLGHEVVKSVVVTSRTTGRGAVSAGQGTP